MKKCPFCAESIQDEAKKCRYCGEWVDSVSIRTTNAIKNTIKKDITNAKYGDIRVGSLEMVQYIRTVT